MYAALPIIVPVYLHRAHGIDDLAFVVWVSLSFFGLVFVPHLLIHLRYTRVSSGQRFQFDIRDRSITARLGADQRKFDKSEIVRTELIVPRSLARKEIIVYPWQQYGFARLYMNSGETILITSLVLPRLQFPFELQNVNVHEKLYCWPK